MKVKLIDLSPTGNASGIGNIVNNVLADRLTRTLTGTENVYTGKIGSVPAKLILKEQVGAKKDQKEPSRVLKRPYYRHEYNSVSSPFGRSSVANDSFETAKAEILGDASLLSWLGIQELNKVYVRPPK
jgi:hypothetical protein